jgi:hypothetical protein
MPTNWKAEKSWRKNSISSNRNQLNLGLEQGAIHGAISRFRISVSSAIKRLKQRLGL